MKNSLQKKFSRMRIHAVPSRLLGKIMTQIGIKQRQHALWSFIFSGVIFVGTLGLLVPVFIGFHSSMTQSGSYQFISLLFSNFSDVAASWQDFILSLLESLPILSIAVFLTTVLFLLASLRFISRDVKILFYRHF